MKMTTFILMFWISFFMADALFAFDYEGNPKGEPFAVVSPVSTPPIPTRSNAGSPQREVTLIRGNTPTLTCGPGYVLTPTPYNAFEGSPRPDPTCQPKR